MAALKSHGISTKEVDTHETMFLLQLYQKLQAGEILTKTSGHRRGSLRQTNTIQTFSTAGMNSLEQYSEMMINNFSFELLMLTSE